MSRARSRRRSIRETRGWATRSTRVGCASSPRPRPSGRSRRSTCSPAAASGDSGSPSTPATRSWRTSTSEAPRPSTTSAKPRSAPCWRRSRPRSTPRATGRSPSPTSCPVSPRAATSRPACQRSGPGRDRYETPLSVACFDLDHFKSVNDTLGHGAGDLVIRRFGEIVRAVVRSTDLACRLRGRGVRGALSQDVGGSARPVAERIRGARARTVRDGREGLPRHGLGRGRRHARRRAWTPGSCSSARTRRSTPPRTRAEPGRVWTDPLGQGARPRPEEPAPAGS